MTKAEQRALEKYPANKTVFDKYEKQRYAFICGYIQAEKDLELCWRDIRIILDAENNILHECNDSYKLVVEAYPKGEDYYSEILKRFKESRKK